MRTPAVSGSESGQIISGQRDESAGSVGQPSAPGENPTAAGSLRLYCIVLYCIVFIKSPHCGSSDSDNIAKLHTPTFDHYISFIHFNMPAWKRPGDCIVLISAGRRFEAVN